jgi:hypothetical protein
VEGGIERAFLDTEDVLRNHLDVEGDAVSVERAASESLEDEEGQGTLEEVVFGFEHGRSYR